MSQNQLSVTHTSSVTPDQIDELGHMNVRYYGQNASAATAALAKQLGVGDASVSGTYTRHHHEQMEGNQLEVRSAVLDDGGDQLRFFHELRNRDNDDLAATFIHDLRSSSANAPTISLPDYGNPRSLDINVDRIATAPSLEELRSRNLAMRLERKVTDEDTMGAQVTPAWLANNLLWGGEGLTDDSSWITDTPDGDRVAFASMETRVSIARLPELGTQIQSFSATLDIGEKILHELSWVFDTGTEELLIAAETIDLAFSIKHRRSTTIRPEIRAEEELRLHPDLARI